MKRQSLSTAAIIVALIMFSGSVFASAPEPVIQVGPGDTPAYDPTEPYRDDQGGRCPAGNTRMGPGGVLDLASPPTTRMPGPVVPVQPAPGPAPAAAPCLADMGLYLVVEAPDGKKPDGADGNLDGMPVSRSSLEGGFELTLPAQDRLITLTDPGENWELKSTTCDCTGWTTLTASSTPAVASAPGTLAAYPRPVIPVQGPSGGPGGCSGSAPSVVSLAALSPGLPLTGGPSEVTSYVRPVVPVTRLQAPRVEWDEDGTVTITDPDRVGGTFTCVWTVELVYGQLGIETVTKPAGEEGRFRYEVVPTGGQPNASARTARGGFSERLRWGPWSVDLAELPEGWKLERSNCSESDISLLSRADGPSAQVGLDPDDAVDCKFELELLAPKPGRWKADNKAGRVVCSARGFSIPFDLSQAVDFGRLQVRDAGDTLIARGGGNSFTFRRDRDRPLRYVGNKRFRQGGATADFRIRLDLRSETRMTGNLRVKLKGNGGTCTARRPLTLTHASAN